MLNYIKTVLNYNKTVLNYTNTVLNCINNMLNYIKTVLNYNEAIIILYLYDTTRKQYEKTFNSVKLHLNCVKQH